MLMLIAPPKAMSRCSTAGALKRACIARLAKALELAEEAKS